MTWINNTVVAIFAQFFIFIILKKAHIKTMKHISADHLNVTAPAHEADQSSSLCVAWPPLTFYSVMHYRDKPTSPQAQVKEADSSFAAKMANTR